MSSQFCTACGAQLRPGARFCPTCGASSDSSGGAAQPPSTKSADRKSTWVILAAVSAVVAVVVGIATTAFVIGRQGGNQSVTEVTLVSANDPGPSPFTESVSVETVAVSTEVTADPTATATTAAQAPAESANVAMRTVSGSSSGLYLRGSQAPCNQGRLIKLLTADPATAQVWATAMRTTPDQITTLVTSFAPVTLANDTAVTNHLYHSGTASPFQSVLQAGTNVLVDAYGVPRVQCSCGNPLDLPEVQQSVEIVGTPWPDYNPDEVDRVEPSPEPQPEIPTRDPDTGEVGGTPVGEGVVGLDGYLTWSSGGIPAVLDESGTSTPVLDFPVSEVFEDGVGGLIYMLPNDDTTHEAPRSVESASIWQLPAGATEPRLLVDAAELRARTGLVSDSYYLKGVAFPAGRRLLFYSEAVAQGEGMMITQMVALDLDTGEKKVLDQGGGAEEHGIESVAGNDEQIVLGGWSAVGTYATILDSDLNEVPHTWSDASLCTISDTYSCDGSMGLSSSGTLVTARSTDRGVDGLRLVDPATGAITGDIDAGVVVDGSVSLDVVGETAILSKPYVGTSAPLTARRIDLASGAIEEIPGTSAKRVTRLHTPIVKRVETTDPNDAVLGDASKVNIRGIGPVKLGMTTSEAEAATGLAMTEDYVFDDTSCGYAAFEGGPVGLDFMIADGVLRTVTVGEGSPLRTSSGIGIGSTEAEVMAAYDNAIEVRPHTYNQNGHYLIYTPTDPSMSDRRAVFHTDGQQVTYMNIGFLWEAEAVEGMSLTVRYDSR